MIHFVKLSRKACCDYHGTRNCEST